ncbi:MAG: thiamine-phosphate kinase, partial [Dehalococcoidia bacterium]
TVQLATTDTLVQDVHFDLDIASWEELGWKTLAVNLSDIAAMGGVAEYALVSLAIPGELELDDISAFCKAMAQLARQYGVAIVGGNIAAAPIVVITAAVIGRCTGTTTLRRSTAHPGEQIAITGYTGLSAAGLEMLRRKTVLDDETASTLRRAHLQPVPRVREGQILVEQGVKTAIDISDGLVADLDHICEMSSVNATVRMDRVPVHRALMANFPNHRELALCGGEDYELLFTADEETLARVKRTLDCPVTVIGEITDEDRPARVTVIDSKGNVISCDRKGWQHFKHEISESRLRQPGTDSTAGKLSGTTGAQR